MQEEVNQKTIALVFRAVSFTARHFEAALREAKRDMERQENAAIRWKNGKVMTKYATPPEKKKHGRMSVKDLVGEGQGAATIQIPDDIKDFQRIARKYNVDFAIKKDKTVDPPKYIVFFRAKDTDVIKECFKDYLNQQSRKRQRVPFKQRLEEFKDLAATLNKNLVKKLHRGERSL